MLPHSLLGILLEHQLPSWPMLSITTCVKVCHSFLMGKSLKKQLKTARKKNRQYESKIENLINDLNALKLANKEATKYIEKTCTKDSLLQKLFKKGKVAKYDIEILNFASTIRFYSTKAYEYLRKFLALPDISTLNKKMKSFKAMPGFHMEAFEELKSHKGDSNYESASLVIDGIHIKSYSQYCPDLKHVFGNIDYGPDIPLDKDEDIVANESLTVMLVGYKKYWKLTIGYFLINGTPSELLVQIVNQALTLSHEAGVNVYNVTMDGATSNVNCAEKLGCKIYVNDRSEIVGYFKHPVYEVTYMVSFYLDPPHMFKNLRNAWQFYKVFYWPGEGLVKFEYLEKLHELQEIHGLRAGGNKITKHHVNFKRSKMKVCLAVQLIASRSVSKTLE